MNYRKGEMNYRIFRGDDDGVSLCAMVQASSHAQALEGWIREMKAPFAEALNESVFTVIGEDGSSELLEAIVVVPPPVVVARRAR